MGFGNLSLNGKGELSNISTISDAIGFFIILIFNVGLAVSVIFVIVGGIKIATSNGDPGKFEEGRNAVMYAVIGALVIISFRVIANFVLSLMGSQEIEKYLMEQP